jgi:hypothetical protein
MYASAGLGLSRNGGQDTLTSNFSKALDTIFDTSTEDSAGGSMSLGMDSTLDEDNAGSMAVTPDLVSSSLANPSPESNNSEVDAAHQALTSSDVKSEDFTDQLRLGAWRGVDSGESASFQSGQWKCDSPMQSLDQPWAIFNS